ncbi:hypothetical protein [Piscinibacter sp.]|uniref:hypothetical protein n=1 Tax=Piscinibacter sp. TaxID=1903157 RepID=UPI002C682FBC|nr:hypothetical protein [Albitalea sp.]HUG21462.1 hypothetical protein [Albitalea sp.]
MADRFDPIDEMVANYRAEVDRVRATIHAEIDADARATQAQQLPRDVPEPMRARLEVELAAIKADSAARAILAHARVDAFFAERWTAQLLEFEMMRRDHDGAPMH